MKKSIFLVEDDVNFGAVLKSYLEMHGFRVTHVEDGKDAIPTFKLAEFDLCVLDIMLPNVDGFTIAKEIRELSPGIPLIFLTAKSLKEDVMKGFEVGADDYVTKPFDSDVLLVKIRAILKRVEQPETLNQTKPLRFGSFEYHPQRRHLKNVITGDYNKLSPREGELLTLLFKHRNNVLERNYTLRTIWGDDNYFNARSMDVYITKLRKYVEEDPQVNIDNVHSSGFILTVPEEK
ncbi:MAG: response regulator transcription factor [Bacteroidota bacterium]